MKGLSVLVAILLLLAANKLAGVLRQAGALPAAAYKAPATILDPAPPSPPEHVSLPLPHRL